ncbi:MAG TPA: metalloregulator ArsR/SmtB family transcription factor [Anaeromyxobacter sp.]
MSRSPSVAQPAAARRRLSRTRVLKAMAHPSRLLVLERLVEGECCVCDLQALVGSDMSTVSKHLALMRRAGLVEDRREGLKVFYRLRAPCVLRFLDCIDAVRDEGTPVERGLPRRARLEPALRVAPSCALPRPR